MTKHKPRTGRMVWRVIHAFAAQLLILLVGYWRYQTELATELDRCMVQTPEGHCGADYHFVWMQTFTGVSIACAALAVVMMIIGCFTRQDTAPDRATSDMAFAFILVTIVSLIIAVAMLVTSP